MFWFSCSVLIFLIYSYLILFILIYFDLFAFNLVIYIWVFALKAMVSFVNFLDFLFYILNVFPKFLVSFNFAQYSNLPYLEKKLFLLIVFSILTVNLQNKFIFFYIFKLYNSLHIYYQLNRKTRPFCFNIVFFFDFTFSSLLNLTLKLRTN